MTRVSNQSTRTIFVGVGEIIIALEPVLVSMVLGSCVSVCIYSIKGSCGGANHFALPLNPSAPEKSEGLERYRYGKESTVTLIESLLSLPGVKVTELMAKVVGGASAIGEDVTKYDVGRLNAEIAHEILATYKIPIVGLDVGGARGRKILFYTNTGRLRVNDFEGKSVVRKENKPLSLISSTMSKQVELASPKPSKVRVLIVDDSRTVQELLRAILSRDEDIEVIGIAPDPIVAVKILKRVRPDVITLDIHMPNMDGVTFLGKLMTTDPIPTIMITAMGLEDGDLVMRALELGAVDYIKKPNMTDLSQMAPAICEKVKAAAAVQLRSVLAPRPRIAKGPKVTVSRNRKPVLAIGASTGGTEAIKEVLLNLSPEIPPIVIVQHIPANFSRAFARRLNEICPFEVKEAESGDKLLSGRVLLAPGGFQMSIEADRLGYKVKLTDAPPVNRHKPSADVLFDSVAKLTRGKACGVILTGMGNDGARGLLAMKRAGCFTIAQDEKTSVVFGMPKEAIRLGAVDVVCELGKIARKIEGWLKERRRIA